MKYLFKDQIKYPCPHCNNFLKVPEKPRVRKNSNISSYKVTCENCMCEHNVEVNPTGFNININLQMF